MNAAHQETIEQLIETLSTSRVSLSERLARWNETTQSALVGNQWIICTPDASCAYKLTKHEDAGDGKVRYTSEICRIEDAPLYGKEDGEAILAYQVETRGGQELVLMRYPDALAIDLQNTERQEAIAKTALARVLKQG